MIACFIENGGPMRKIAVRGSVIEFEMHPYCGPTMLTKRGDPLSVQPDYFLVAASQWAQQGQKIEDGLCVYDPNIPLRYVNRPNSS